MRKVRLSLLAIMGICMFGLFSCSKDGKGSDELCDHRKADPQPYFNFMESQAEQHVVDYRSEEDFAKGHLLNAINIPATIKDLDGANGNCEYVKKVLQSFNYDTDTPLFVYGGKDAFGTKGMAVPGQLACKFKVVTLLVGGYDGWVKEGLPTTVE